MLFFFQVIVAVVIKSYRRICRRGRRLGGQKDLQILGARKLELRSPPPRPPLPAAAGVRERSVASVQESRFPSHPPPNPPANIIHHAEVHPHPLPDQDISLPSSTSSNSSMRQNHKTFSQQFQSSPNLHPQVPPRGQQEVNTALIERVLQDIPRVVEHLREADNLVEKVIFISSFFFHLFIHLFSRSRFSLK